jgi:expansin (peptidoglycan-binding protein)
MGQWQSGRICGQCAEVTALTSQGLKTTVVRIMDRCADANCGIDLGGAAPAAVMANGSGRYLGQWRFVSCAGHPEVSDGVPSLNVISGSNAWWARLRVMNPVSAVQGITWKTATSAGSLPYAHDPENSYELPVSDVLQSTSSSVQLTVTYSDGSTATAQLTPAQLGTGGSTYPLQ